MKILVLEEHAEEYADHLGHLADHIEYATQPNQVPEDCDVLLAQPDFAANFFDSGGKTDWVQSTWAGIRPLADLHPAPNAIITGVKGIFGAQMAEYIFTYILQEIRNPNHFFELQQDAVWQQSLPGTLPGRHMTIVGTGAIGSHIAQVAQTFGLSVTGVSRRGEMRPGFDRVLSIQRLREAVAAADYVVLVLPDTPAATNVLNREVFSAMQAKPLLFNVGRGNTIETNALFAALREGAIRGAVLDVFATEPLPKHDPLWREPGVLITPHISAVSFPVDVAKIFLANLEKFKAGVTLDYEIDLTRGY